MVSGRREKCRRQGGGGVLGVVGGKGGGRVEETGWRVCVRVVGGEGDLEMEELVCCQHGFHLILRFAITHC